MSHHISEVPAEQMAELRKAFGIAAKLGATGVFPNGKVADLDKGEIRFAVSADPARRLVMLDFGDKPISFVGMTPDQAVETGTALIDMALKARGIV